MFGVLTRRSQRRLSSPRTIAFSVAAHVFILGGVALASASGPAEPTAPGVDTLLFPLDPPAPRDPTPPPPPVDEPEDPDAPAPTPGHFVQVQPPPTVPKGIAAADPLDRPLKDADVQGRGRPGDVRGTPPAFPVPPTGARTPGWREVFDPSMVESLPEMENRAEVDRLLRRQYPTVLLDAGVTGKVVLEMVVRADGSVEPGSVRVVTATHERFEEASIRVAEKMRFRPARIGDEAVAVRVTLPIDWSLDR